jgi:hypothetical protein
MSKIIDTTYECGYRRVPSNLTGYLPQNRRIIHCTHPNNKGNECAIEAEFPITCPLQNSSNLSNTTTKDILKDNTILELEPEIPTATRIIECPICRGRGLVHTEEGSSLIDCENCNSTGKIEIGT